MTRLLTFTLVVMALMLTASIDLVATTCEVTNPSGENAAESFLRHIINTVNPVASQRCTTIVFKVNKVDPLASPAFIYEGVQIIGNGVTLTLKNPTAAELIRVVGDDDNTYKLSGPALIQNIKLSNPGGAGIRVIPRVNSGGDLGSYAVLEKVTVTNSKKGLEINGDRVDVKNSIITSNDTGITIAGAYNRIYGSSVYKNKGSGIYITGSNNSVGSTNGQQNAVKIYENGTHGVLVSGSNAISNRITKNSFYDNVDVLGIKLLNNANNKVAHAVNQFAIYDSSDPSLYLLVGHVKKDTKMIELFKSDHNQSGEGKTYVKSFPSGTLLNTDWNNDGKVLYAGIVNADESSVNTAIVTTVTDTTMSTSRFSGTIIPSSKHIPGDPIDCQNGKGVKKPKWFMESVEELGGSADNVWNQDYDGDGATNGEEDTNQNCVKDPGESDPTDPNSKPKIPHTYCEKPYQDLLEAILCSLAEGLKECKETYKFSPDTNNNGMPDPCDDLDGDGIIDFNDNCPGVYNPAQSDNDGDGIGDLCDDDDEDGIPNIDDNCPNTFNTDQKDLDGDGAGDKCDPDLDNDGLMNPYCSKDIPSTGIKNCSDMDEEAVAGTLLTDPDSDDDGMCDGTGWGYGTSSSTRCQAPMDNCPLKGNATQTDFDEDSIGNTCDLDPQNPFSFVDSDKDGTEDLKDNCPFIANTDQADNDGDGLGDACDSDDDNDGIDDATESGMQRGSHGAGVPLDPKHPDSDGDGYCDGSGEGYGGLCYNGPGDNCPYIANADQKDSDGDGIGDLCDLNFDDEDEDGVLDAVDNCVAIPNKDQRDTDKDGIGNACDQDDDNDGFTDVYESGPYREKWPTGVFLHFWEPDSDHYKLVGTKYDNMCDGPGTGFGLPNDFTTCEAKDNCPTQYNPDQSDGDFDGFGDLCDEDFLDAQCDDDGVPNELDNCPCVYNPSQIDSNGNGIGDECDEDFSKGVNQNPSGSIPPPPIPSVGLDIFGGGQKSGGCSLVATSDAAVSFFWIGLSGLVAYLLILRKSHA